MGFVKDIREIKENSKKILEETKTFTKDNAWKIKEYDKISELLKNVKLNVKEAKLFVNNDGLIGVSIDYNFPSIKVLLDEDGTVVKDNRFYSVNMLNLIPFEDMQKIQSKINEARRMNTK